MAHRDKSTIALREAFILARDNAGMGPQSMAEYIEANIKVGDKPVDWSSASINSIIRGSVFKTRHPFAEVIAVTKYFNEQFGKMTNLDPAENKITVGLGEKEMVALAAGLVKFEDVQELVQNAVKQHFDDKIAAAMEATFGIKKKAGPTPPENS